MREGTERVGESERQDGPPAVRIDTICQSRWVQRIRCTHTHDLTPLSQMSSMEEPVCVYACMQECVCVRKNCEHSVDTLGIKCANKKLFLCFVPQHSFTQSSSYCEFIQNSLTFSPQTYVPTEKTMQSIIPSQLM